MSVLAVNSIVPANAGSEDYFLTRAWVNFDGSGTVSIRADGNISSLTDNGTGIYTTSFSAALTDASYSTVGVCRESATGYGDFVSFPSAATYSTSAVQVRTTRAWNDTQNVNSDCNIVNLQVTR